MAGAAITEEGVKKNGTTSPPVTRGGAWSSSGLPIC